MGGRLTDSATRNVAILAVFEDCQTLTRQGLIGLLVADYDAEAGVLSLPASRGGRRAAALSGETSGALAAWLDVRGEDPGALFVSVTPPCSNPLSVVKVYRVLVDLARSGELGLASRAAAVLRRQGLS